MTRVYQEVIFDTGKLDYLKIMEENIEQHRLNDAHVTTASDEISLMSK